MRGVIASGAGGPQSLMVTDVPEPTPGPGEVLLRVVASAVNRADLMQRDGHYPPPPGITDVLGLEAAGEVVAVGSGVHDVEVGSAAMVLLAGGGNAERAVVPAGHVMPIPESFTWEQAAAIPEVFLTAYLTLVVLGRLDAGETALVHAAASGVGTAAVQIAHAVGAAAIATSRTAERLELPVQLGAKGVVVDAGHFAHDVLRLTDGRGADVILDLIGAAYWRDNAAAVARGGRIVLTGLLGGRTAEVDLGGLLANNVSVIGSTLRGRTVDEKSAIIAAFVEWAMPRFADGTLRPIVAAVLPLDDVARGHELVASNTVVGKVVLRVA